MKKILFVLSIPTNHPVGGYKTVYEYSNRLIKKGYDVTIAFPCGKYGIRPWIPSFIQKIYTRIAGTIRVHKWPTWFSLDPRVKKIGIFNERQRFDDYDVIIATARYTSYFVAKQKCKKKCYFIQGFENWHGVSDEEVYDSYRLGLTNLVITNWLKQVVDKVIAPKKSILLPNGLDYSIFHKLDLPREPHSVAMLYHAGDYKGSKYGIAAILCLKDKYPDLKAYLFGAPERPADLPDWISYTQNIGQQDLCKLYNRVYVYMYPSIQEGLGLTCIESMACGCALAVSDYKGAGEFAFHEKTALVSSIRDSEAMAVNVSRLFEDEALRKNIAENGESFVNENFDWNKSVDKLIHVIER